MKYIRRIIFIAILILGLASCKKKSNGEIEYKLYENVELGECDEFDVSYKIPSHQYVHITFTKNTPWIIYNLNVYELKYEYINGTEWTSIKPSLEKTNIYDVDASIYDNYKVLNNHDTYLENDDYYIDIYNDSNEEKEYVCKMINRKKYTDNYYYYDFEPYSSDIWNCLDRGEVLNYNMYEPAKLVKIVTTYDNFGEKYKVNFTGDENVSIKILDSYGNEVGNNITKNIDDNNYIYYACIYKTSNITETANFSISVDYAEIYDGYEIEIPNYPTPYSYNHNRFIFNCTESGIYNLISTNSNITIGINEEGFNSIISFSTSRNNISLEKGKKYYIDIRNESLSENQTGIINITKVEETTNNT